ncbi:MAG: septum formation family protein [Pseudomonadota bacterium]
MNATIIKTTLSLIMIVTLAACGGGSGGGQPPIAGPTPPSPSPGPGTPEIGAVIEMADLEPGTCVDPIGLDGDLEYLKVTDCNATHAFEIAGTVQRPEAVGDAFPGDRELALTSNRDCRPAFEAHVGRPYDGEGLAINTIVPSRGTWRTGDRDIICLITGENGAPLDQPAGG